MASTFDDRAGSTGRAHEAGSDSGRPAPGKVTLTAGLSTRSGAVQRAADGAAPPDDPARVQAIADRGVDDAHNPLPYADVITRSFGRHDVGDVKTATGGAAAEASHALGARAYATGDTIAFGSAPDLRLAAHEAAHVVQQRAGVHLDGGVGQAGDPYEVHADAVADLVVRGESAEGLLDRHAGGGGGGGVQRAVQRFGEGEGGGGGGTTGSTGGGGGTTGATGTSAATGTTADGAPTATGTVAPVPPAELPAWDAFAAAFVGFPSDVRALFGGAPTGTQLAQVFTATQRDKMTAFLGNAQIPERLFNGGDVAAPPAQPQAANARQRILISSHIMTTGTYANRQSEQQRVEARMCGHFVTLVNAYAGVGSENAGDVRGNFDFRGDVVLFAGGSGRTTHDTRDGFLPIEQFDTIQPGDWLYIRAAINHSVVFSAWESDRISTATDTETDTPIRSRMAITYDQRHNGRGEGGLRHEHTRLGERPCQHPYVWAITRVQPPEETNIATTAEDLLPAGADLEGAAARNRAGLEASGLTLEVAIAWVRTENTTLIEHVGRPRAGGAGDSRLSPQQRSLLEEANRAEDLEHLVHLNERLQRLADGVDLLEAGDAGGPRAYGTFDDHNASTRAAGGYDLSHGGISGDRFDTVRESATTGLLQNVRQPLSGFRAAPAGRARRGRGAGGGGGGGGGTTPG